MCADTAHGADDANAQSPSLDAGVCYAHCHTCQATELKPCVKDAAWQHMGSWELSLGIRTGGSLLSAFVCSLQPVWTSYRLYLVQALPARCNGAVLVLPGLGQELCSPFRMSRILNAYAKSTCCSLSQMTGRLLRPRVGWKGYLRLCRQHYCKNAPRPAILVPASLAAWRAVTCLCICHTRLHHVIVHQGLKGKLVSFDAWQCMMILHQACSSLHLLLAGA